MLIRKPPQWIGGTKDLKRFDISCNKNKFKNY